MRSKFTSKRVSTDKQEAAAVYFSAGLWKKGHTREHAFVYKLLCKLANAYKLSSKVEVHSTTLQGRFFKNHSSTRGH